MLQLKLNEPTGCRRCAKVADKVAAGDLDA
jgi:hypothetical protein